jgi:uncharacterized protein (TIGR00297 family)
VARKHPLVRTLVRGQERLVHGLLELGIWMLFRRLVTSVGLSGMIGFLGWRRRALSPSGVAGAVIVGTAAQLAGRWRWSALLLTFFGTSSALSRLRKANPRTNPGQDIEARGSQRDLVQALANGGVAAAVAVMHLAHPAGRLEAAFAGSFAAANADTWSTEIGKTSPNPPRLITTGAVAPAGTSGAVTPRGLLGAAAGSSVIAAVYVATGSADNRFRRATGLCAAGFLGALVDSLAGATVQASYSCEACAEPTERRVHRCGSSTTLQSGYAWCNNDMVNVVCTATGALAAALLAPRDDQRRGTG